MALLRLVLLMQTLVNMIFYINSPECNKIIAFQSKLYNYCTQIVQRSQLSQFFLPATQTVPTIFDITHEKLHNTGKKVTDFCVNGQLTTSWLTRQND